LFSDSSKDQAIALHIAMQLWSHGVRVHIEGLELTALVSWGYRNPLCTSSMTDTFDMPVSNRNVPSPPARDTHDVGYDWNDHVNSAYVML